MTPADFATAYVTTARAVSDGTGIDSAVLLAQWANETAWGTVVVGNNLGNIRCSPTTFCSYATLDDFATACIATFHNGFYNAVLAATTPAAQLAALVASPWSSDHYGGTLDPFYNQVEAYEMTPQEHSWLENIANEALGTVNELRGAAAHSKLDTIVGVSGLGGGQLDRIETEVKAIATPPPATVDLTPVLTAIAQVQTALTALQAAVTAIKVKTDRDLA
jgi:hypothetical protein